MLFLIVFVSLYEEWPPVPDDLNMNTLAIVHSGSADISSTIVYYVYYDAIQMWVGKMRANTYIVCTILCHMRT